MLSPSDFKPTIVILIFNSKYEKRRLVRIRLVINHNQYFEIIKIPFSFFKLVKMITAINEKPRIANAIVPNSGMTVL